MSIEPSKKIDKFRAKRILEVGNPREATFNEQLAPSNQGNVVSISAQDLGKIMKVPFDSKDHKKFLDALNNIMAKTGSLLSMPMSLANSSIEGLCYTFQKEALEKIAEGQKRSK